MQTTTLARYGAPTAIVAGALMIITRLVILFTVPAEIGPFTAYVLTTTHAVTSVVSILAFALLVIALVVLYEHEAHRAGAFGALAFGAAVIGTMFMTGDWWYEAFAVPRLAEVAPDVVDTFVGGRLIAGGLTSFALFGIGWVLYGAASTRARAIPRSLSITILVAGLMSGVPIGIVYLSGGVVHGMAFVGLGMWMLRAASARVSDAAAGSHSSRAARTGDPVQERRMCVEAHQETGRVLQMRLVVEAADYDEAVRFYRDVLGAGEELQIHGDAGEKVTILDVGRATLEISNPEQVDMIDRVEVGRRVSPHLRVAFEVLGAESVTDALVDAGAELIAPPTVTPWHSLNARLQAPGNLQVTVFQEQTGSGAASG